MKIWLMLFCCFFLLSCSKDNTQEDTSVGHENVHVENVQNTVDFVLNLANGGTLEIQEGKNGRWHFKNMQERLKLLFFFTVSCEPCRSVIPHLVDIQENHKNHLEVLGISLDDPTNSLNDFLESYNINFKVAHSSLNRNFLEALNVDLESIELPYMVLYDANGEYVIHYMGAIPQEMLEFDIKRVLAQNGESSDGDNEEEVRSVDSL